MRKKNHQFYITTSIAYVNALPHIGFALELVQADVLARYRRLVGNDVYFLTGTDEHGAKIVKAAEAAGLKPQIFASQNAKKYQELGEKLNISNDAFIRTSDQKKHWPSVKNFWLKLVKNGDIYKKNYQGLYCVGHEAFITKKDLVNGKCPDHNVSPEAVREENYFFRLTRYAKKIESKIKKDELKIIPTGRKNEILKFIKQGLEDISFSRPRKDLSWGIPVPDDKTQTVYVWADALVNYISALGFPKNKLFKKYWPADIHLIGKDISRFHAVIWPAMLLSARLALPKSIFVHGHILADGKKMSKTLSNVIDPFDVIERYGVDALRYWLLRDIPTAGDGDFTYEKFIERYNGDLAKGLGNLVARVSRLASSKNKIQAEKIDPAFNKEIKTVWRQYKKEMENFNFHKTLGSIWRFIGFCDRYIDKNKPWELLKSKNSRFDQVMLNLLYGLSEIGWLLMPFLPETAEKIFLQIGLNPAHKKSWLKFGFKPKYIKPLFPHLDHRLPAQ
ncbi:MAG: methionine--tRNA ligase [Parcubacteria group bacterium]|nr:methionine--tRNA ligase [Parcubacteria group bacterium]